MQGCDKTGPKVRPGRGGGPSARMVVGASAPADTLQVRQTTMECTGRSKVSGSTVSIAAFPAAEPVPMSRYSVLSGPHAPTTGQARSPAPAGRTWPPARDERDFSPGGEPSRVYGYRSFCPLGGRDGFACGEPPTSLGSETRTSGEPPVVRSLRAHALHSALFTFGHE